MYLRMTDTSHQPADRSADGRALREAADALASELRVVVRGEVRFDAGTRALYATDASNYRQVPIGVVIPRDLDDVVEAVAVCRRHGAPILGRGGGTSLAGQCCNVAVVFDTSKYMNQVLAVDSDRRVARVQPGTILDTLQQQARPFGLIFGPDPSTHSRCTLGGMIGNDSCGAHSVMSQFYGAGVRTSDNLEELEVLTYDGTRLRVGATGDAELDWNIQVGGRRGEIYQGLLSLRDRYADLIRQRFPKIPRIVSGYNLPALLPENGFNVAAALSGTEGTCVMYLEASIRLLSDPPARTLLLLGYPSIYEAADHVPELMAHKPIGLEGMDDRLVKDIQRAGRYTDTLNMLPEGNGWLLIEFGGNSREEADAKAFSVMAELERSVGAPTMKLCDDAREQQQLWKVREYGLGATAHVTEEQPTWPGWEDSAVPPEKFGTYLRRFRTLLDRYGYIGDLYGHFGQGCLHTNTDFDLTTAMRSR
jgi:FAD/FMN-containing dehydrogenase